MWPGFGDNLRVLSWVIERCEGRAGAQDTPIGFMPKPEELALAGLDIDQATVKELTSVDPALWQQEMTEIGKYLAEFGDRVPAQLTSELSQTVRRLG
jgi:phosphoenolpyruvate carboxykinase (GTP)